MEWRKDEQPLATNGEGYEIQASYTDLEATTSLVFTDSYLSRSFEGTYDVVITNVNEVIPVAERIATTSFSISVTGQWVQYSGRKTTFTIQWQRE